MPLSVVLLSLGGEIPTVVAVEPTGVWLTPGVDDEVAEPEVGWDRSALGVLEGSVVGVVCGFSEVDCVVLVVVIAPVEAAGKVRNPRNELSFEFA